MAFINYELGKDVAIDTCIQNALDDLEQLKWTFGSYNIVGIKIVWRLIKALYGCGRKKGKGVQCEAALSSLEANIYQHSLELQFVCLALLEASVKDLNFGSFLSIKREAIMGEMEELHWILLNESSLEKISASHIEMEDLLVIIDSLLHLSYFSHDLEESIRFLKNFIGFVRLRGLEANQMGDLLVHAQGVLVDAACFCFRNSKLFAKGLDVYQLVDRIQPLESQVCEIYVRVLQKVLGLSESSSNNIVPALRSQTPLLADFVDSLLFLLRQLLFRHAGHVYPHMYKLYQGLRFLRTAALAEQDDEIDELDRQRDDLIGVLICEAGVTVCYLIYGQREASLDGKIEKLFLSFEEKFKLLKPEEEFSRYQLPSACPQTNLLGFIDSLLVKISSANPYGVAYFSADSTMHKLNTIHDDLAYLSSFLANVMGQKNQNGELQVLWSRVATVAYETEFALDSLLVGYAHQSLIVPLGAIISEIERIKTETLAISDLGQFDEFQMKTKIESKKHLAGKIPKFDEPIVGLDDESQNTL